MHYYEWNNFIGSHLFNVRQAGVPVYLAIRKNDIINLGRQHCGLADEEVWKDFVKSIQAQADPGSSLIKKIETLHAAYREAFRSTFWERRDPVTRRLIRTFYPPHLALLVTSVLPLAEESVDYIINPNNYHDRANRFFAENNLPHVPRQDRQSNWNSAWEDLSDWALRIKQGELGLFDSNNFTNNHYVYVGKAFAQCLIPTRLFNQLPKLFEKAELIPDQILSGAQIQQLVLKFSNELALSNKAKELISKKSDELGQFVRRTIQQNQEQWNGENGLESTELAWTIGGLRLTFRDPKKTNFNFKLNYRFKSKTNLDYPDNLQFEVSDNQEIICQEITDGWSNELLLPFNQDGYLLESPSTRWRARTVKRSRRAWLFTRASTIGLSGDSWIETDVIALNQSEMYLLYDKTHITIDKKEFDVWQKHFPANCFSEITQHEFDGIPSGYSLFKFSQASKPLTWLSHLTFPTEKRIELVGGLKLSYGVYYALEAPRAMIIAETGQEVLQALLENKTLINLYRSEEEPSLFCFPSDFPLDVRFQLQIDGEEVKTIINYCLANSIATSTESESLPCWNNMGERCKKNNSDKYEQGLVTTGVKYEYQENYIWHFFPGSLVATSKSAYPINSVNDRFDELLNYLSARKEASTQQFASAFEVFFSKRFPNQSINANGLSTSQFKRRSLSMLSALGHIEYDDVQNRIWINSTRLIPLPARRGRRALLTGYRSDQLILKLNEVASQFNVSVSIENHPARYQHYLLPSVIVLIADGPSSSLYGQRAIEQVAKNLNIPYDVSNIPQFGLLSLSASLSDYAIQALDVPEDATLMSYCAHPFNINTLYFNKEVASFNPEFALVEYKLKPWDRRIYLWKNNQSYRVDRRWSCYYYLYQLKRRVIQVDPITKDLLVPFSLPLPRHIARAFTLMSGKAPDVLWRTDCQTGQSLKYTKYEHSDNLLTNNFLNRLGQ